MRVTQDGPDDGPDLVFIMGWGNQFHHENIRWLIEEFVAAGYRVHTFQIPELFTDFYGELVEPVQEYVDDLDEFRLVGHSTGGLVAPFVDGPTTRTYLSPWWGFRRGQVGADDLLLSLFAKIPTTRKIIPTGEGQRDEIGQLATDRQFEEGPEWAAPTFFREGQRAHRDRPPIGDDVVVFCTPRDAVVSVRAIGEAVDSDQLVLYDGGHELFSSPCRNEHIETLLAVIEDGIDGLP